MTLTEAVEAAEKFFAHVHREIGFPTPYEDQAGKAIGHGPRDMTCAPNGEPYDTVTSMGINEGLQHATVLFINEGLAFRWWLDEVRDHQMATGARHLYWCSEPTFVSATFLAMDQARLMRTQNPLAQLPQIDLGYVTSKLLISKKGLNGKED